jgi:hypothetical protein
MHVERVADLGMEDIGDSTIGPTDIRDRQERYTSVRILEKLRKRLGLTSLSRWHLGAPRQVQPGQRIHESVFDKINKDPGYSPKARLYGDLNWRTSEELRDMLIEEDPYTKVAGILERLQASISDATDKDLDILLIHVQSGKPCLFYNLFDVSKFA